MDRISARTCTRSEWKAWRRYWKLLMQEGKTERVILAERSLEFQIACASVTQFFRRLNKPILDLGKEFAALAPIMRSLISAFDKKEGGV